MLLITITGPSGAGKDTVARMLSEKTGIPVLCSYTTRPMREGEENGREHFFVKECDVPHSDMLAYTQYGGYEYWTLKSQLQGNIIYVIDEEGLRNLYHQCPDVPTVHLYVDATEKERRARGVSEERIERDKERKTLPEDFYQYFIHNSDEYWVLNNKVSNFVVWLTIRYRQYLRA